MNRPTLIDDYIPDDIFEGNTLVFVPGIMGSALLYRGPGPIGNPVEEYVWSEDVSDILSAKSLERLVYPTPAGTVLADHIIERATMWGARLLKQEVYGPWLNYLREKARRKGVRLIEFPYDWRASIVLSAEQLRKRLLDEQGTARRELVLISHSMGGLVCQLALAGSEELRQRVRLRVHIATPFKGSVKAFWTLKISPVLSPAYDRLLLPMLNLWDAWRAVGRRARYFDQLMQAIRTFPSLYELLPPHDMTPLIRKTGELLSCVDESVWSQPYRSLVANARQVHEQLVRSSSLETPLLVVYSASHGTDQTYSVSASLPSGSGIRKVNDSVQGDGTVTAYSASYKHPQAALYLEGTLPGDHISICRNFATFREFERRLKATQGIEP